MDAKVIVDCEEPAVRAAIVGLITSLLRNNQLTAEAKPLAHQTELVNQAVLNSQVVADGLASIAGLNIIVVEQLTLTPELVHGAEGHSGHGPSPQLQEALSQMLGGTLSPPLGMDPNEVMKRLGLKKSDLEDILNKVHDRVGTHGGQMTEEQADQVCSLACEMFEEYLSEKLPGCPIKVMAEKNRTPSGKYEFAIAIAVDPEGMNDYFRKEGH